MRPSARRHPPLLRDFQATQHADLFLVAAVSTVLGVRAWLHATGYPQVGGATLHVAHMLWGGLLMLLALGFLLLFLGRRPRRIAALVGGIGFGLFIDEIGKFVTRDNDYFYQPAVALIYVTFVLVYLAMRTLYRRHATDDERVVNALQEMEQAVVHDLDEGERNRAIAWIAGAGAHPMARSVETLVRTAPLAPTREPGRLARWRQRSFARYERVASHPRFASALVAFFVAQLALKLLHVVVLALRDASPAGTSGGRLWSLTTDRYSTAEWLQLASSLLSALLVLRGIVAMRGSRLDALRWFQRSILVSIFLTQVFMFYRQQWGALATLAFNLVVLAALDFVLAQERRAAAVTPP